ncbi:MAG: glycerophosphodiester phosphodiesterase [Candidatus Heimdallarchaeota archaeon]
MKIPLIFGHRGSSIREPENTMRALQAAIQEGADGVEFDVRITKDREIVIIHDAMINRTSNGNGRVKKFNCSELLGFDFGKGEKIPLLKDVLKKYGNKYWLNIEIKETGFECDLIEMLREFKITEKVVISSFKKAALKIIAKLTTDIPLAYLFNRPMNNFTKLQKLKFTSIHPGKSLVNKQLIQAANKANLKVRVWTVDDFKEAKRLAKLGVDGIITNDPQGVIQALRTKK